MMCVYGCREHGLQLAQLLQSKHTDAALEMLSAEPSLAWIRDDESGGYPLHIAVWHVRRTTLLMECLCHIPAHHLSLCALRSYTVLVETYTDSRATAINYADPFCMLQCSTRTVLFLSLLVCNWHTHHTSHPKTGCQSHCPPSCRTCSQRSHSC